MLAGPNLCDGCVHYLTEGQDKCTAYPNGIPIDIRNGYADHFDTRGDDGLIIFEPIEGAEELLGIYLAYWYEPVE